MSSKIFEVPENGLKAQRLKELKTHFLAKFGSDPEFYVRAPGRVNIIGEHIDYCGYAVFPMAIEQDIIVAVAAREDSKLCISNVNSKYESFECDIKNYVIGDIKFKWYKYILCGLEGVKEAQAKDSLRGLSLRVGEHPSFGGSLFLLSPSLRFGSDDVTLLPRGALASRARRTQRTSREVHRNGRRGMDQAASFLSKAGSAQLIEFNPLRCTPVQLPEGALFVVANSLVEKNKAAGSDFNTRVVECRLACRLMAKKAGIPMSKNMPLGDLQKTLGKSFSEMVESVKEILHPQPYSKQEVCQLLNMSVSQLEKDVLSANTLHVTEFQLHNRALHVFTEGSRVWEFKNICDDWHRRRQGTSCEDNTKVLQQLGQLMDESHSSAQHLYECSHPQLDKLVRLSKGVAFGARLTGAGWGGCIIALVAKERVEEYQALIKRDYYNSEGLEISDWSSVLFSTEPSSGACIYSPDINSGL